MAREEIANSKTSWTSEDEVSPAKKQRSTMAKTETDNEEEQSATKKPKLVTGSDNQSSTDDDDEDDDDQSSTEEEEEEGEDDDDDVDDDVDEKADDDVGDVEEEEEDELTLEEKLLPADYVDEDDDPSHDITEKVLKEAEKYENAPPIFHSDPTPLDISGASFNVIDPDKETDDWDLEFFYDFMDICHRKKNLETFNHPGDPRMGGMAHRVGKDANMKRNRDVAQIAIDEYRKCNPNANLTLKKVKCVNDTAYYCWIYYLTFKAKDNNTNKTNTYQAALWNDLDRRYELGLFRDVSNDKVLAILKVKGATYDHGASKGGSASAALDNSGKVKEETRQG